MKLVTKIVDKPWGQTALPAQFPVETGRRVGEIWFEAPAGALPRAAALDVMIKYLFTTERLSIQVHPNDAQARARGYPRGKEEAWVVVDAAPGAEIGIGLTRDATAEELRAACLDGSIERLIDWRPTRKGDVWYNSAGTIHAVGPGLVVAEVQQAVDLTYRLYDYGRPRELHLDDGLAVAIGAPHHDPRDGRVPDTGSKLLVDGPKFAMAWCDGEVPPFVAGAGPFQLLPIDGPATAAGEAIAAGECGLAPRATDLAVPPGTRALIAWPVHMPGAAA